MDPSIQLLEHAKQVYQNSSKRPFTIAIEGTIGSGKSYSSEVIQKGLDKEVQVISTDTFIIVSRHKWNEKVAEGGIVLDTWYDLEKIKEVFQRLKRREKFTVEGLYNLSDGTFTRTMEFDATHCNAVILEGLFALHDVFHELFDYRIYIDTDIGAALKDAEQRDKTVRNITQEQWDLKIGIYHDGYLPYVEKHRSRADYIHRR